MDHRKLSQKEAVTIMARAWNNLDASMLEPYISEDIVFWSQQALTDVAGKKAVMAYLSAEMETIRKLPDERVYVELGETKPLPMAADNPEPCVVLARGHKENIRALALLKLECGKINSIGICSDAPHPSTARRSGKYPL